MNSVPALLILSVGVFAAIVTAGRWLLTNDSSTDRLINRLWTWELTGFLLHGVASGAGSPDLARRLFMGCGLMAGACAYGFARLLFDGQARYTARRRQRWYDGMAIVAAGSILLAEPVADHLLPFSWSALIWTLSGYFSAVAGFILLVTCVRELRSGELTLRQRLFFVVLFVLSLYWSIGSVIGGIRTALGAPPSEPGWAWTIVIFVSFCLATLLISVRLVDVLLARTRWDRAGRHCRRLTPMWRDLTTAVPEVVLAQDDSVDQDSAHRRYRMTVEIWDALLRLRPYVRAPANGPGTRTDERGYAQVLAEAGRAKLNGMSPVAQPTAVLPRPADRASELRMLLGLARVWPTSVDYDRPR